MSDSILDTLIDKYFEIKRATGNPPTAMYLGAAEFKRLKDEAEEQALFHSAQEASRAKVYDVPVYEVDSEFHLMVAR